MAGSLLAFTEVASLVRRARRGDTQAFRRLLELHRDTVSSTLVACGVRCRETARDLAQETAMTSWTRLSTLKDPQSFPAWIRRIAANAARDHLRRLAVRREESLEEALDLRDEDDPHRHSERTAEMRLMLAALETEDETVVQLLTAHAEGSSITEMAAASGLSEGALKMRLTRARQRLRRRLKELRGS